MVNEARTEMVSPSGATVECSYPLSWGQELLVTFANKEILARIVGQTGIGDQTHSYGISFLQENRQFWGVSFPKCERRQPEPLLLECCRCGKGASSFINEIEALVLSTNRLLLLHCSVCNDTTYWKIADPAADLKQGLQILHQAGRDAQANWEQTGIGPDPDVVAVASMCDEDMFRPAPRRERRRHKRMDLSKAKACIERLGAAADIVEVVNVSKSGAGVRTPNFYPIGSWIRIACPYTIGGSNIFQSGRIVRTTSLDKVREYGIEYVRLM